MPGGTLKLSEKEHGVASWVFEHNQPAGQFTSNLPLSEALYLPLATPAGTVGVLGVRLSQTTEPNLEQKNLLEAFARQASLVLDRQRLHDVAQQAHLAEESERLSKTLLDSISHEMRTPIAAITGAASGLSDPGLNARPELNSALVGEIKEAVTRLNRLVGNILDIARVESGHVKPKLDWCDVGDLVNVTVKSLQKELTGRQVDIMLAADLPLVRMDFVLMEQALTNLLLNAAVHTPAGVPIRISAAVRNGELALGVADKGPGIPTESLPKIFDKFYRAPGAATGGTGLGLSIVKGFVEAQHGRVEAGNPPGWGATFTIYLPIGEPPAFPGEPA
jgi:two-component system sensor histidine kinase KdpD